MISLLTWLGLLLGVAGTFGHIIATDFPVDMIIYREGVRAFLSGGEMYSEPMMAGDLALPFIYPPFGALVMVPLTAPFISDAVAGDIMIVVSNALILVCLYLVLRVLLKSATDSSSAFSEREVRMLTALLWGGAVMIEPVDLNNGFAQLNIVLMALVVFDLVPGRRPKWLPQGLLVGVAAAIKLTPLVFGLYWLLRRDFRSILTAAVSAVVCTLIAALWRFDATVEFYFSTLLGMGSESQIGVDTTYQSNSSLKGMVMRWAPSSEALDAGGTLINVIWLILAGVTIVLGGWLMVALLRRGMRIDAIMVNAVVMLLISPVSWSHHWVWLVFILPLFAWRAATLFAAPWFSGGVVALWSLLVLTNPPKWWFGDQIDIFALNGLETFLVSDFVWLGIALLVAVAVGLRGVPVQTSGQSTEKQQA